jgi:hypothetical protein
MVSLQSYHGALAHTWCLLWQTGSDHAEQPGSFSPQTLKHHTLSYTFSYPFKQQWIPMDPNQPTLGSTWVHPRRSPEPLSPAAHGCRSILAWATLDGREASWPSKGIMKGIKGYEGGWYGDQGIMVSTYIYTIWLWLTVIVRDLISTYIYSIWWNDIATSPWKDSPCYSVR